MQKCHNLYWKEYNPCPETPCSTDLPYTKSKTDQLSYLLDCIYLLYMIIYTLSWSSRHEEIGYCCFHLYTCTGHFLILACRPIHNHQLYWLSWILVLLWIATTNLLTQAWQPSTAGNTVLTGGSIQSLTEKIRQYDQSGIPVLSSYALSHAHCRYPTR